MYFIQKLISPLCLHDCLALEHFVQSRREDFEQRSSGESSKPFVVH